MRKLSKATPKEKFAYCRNCDEWFIDDVLLFNTLYCPNAECWNVLLRCLTLKTVIKMLLEQHERK